MPHCPKCSKRCKTDQTLIRHMCQPGSSCAKLTNYLISIPQLLQPQVLPLDGDQDGADMDFTCDDYCPTSFDVEMTLDDEQPSSSNTQGSRYREDFTGASKVYGAGKSFMEKFDSDVFAEQRKDNPYYPFASMADWEMGAFLLRSRMSMVMVDEFLKLKIVSTSLQFYCPEII